VTAVAVGSMLLGSAAGLGIMAVLAFILYSLIDGWRTGAIAAGLYLTIGGIIAIIGWIVLAGAR
jgi:hypothetical protein